MAEDAAARNDPDYITYLMDPEIEHDCYFLVGNEKLVKPEKIGVVKKMLLAHSIVLRAELQDSKLAEKSLVPITDIYPDTFKNLLKFVYGYNNISTLSFDDADNLLYVAEKYIMIRLKNKIAARLMSLLTYENICGLMNNPACFNHLTLQSAITQVLQFETEKVFASLQFLELCPEGFLKILEQDVVTVREIDVWRAALRWAKHRVASEDREVMRQELKNQLKQIRFCTMSSEDLTKEVVPSGILTRSEVDMIRNLSLSNEVTLSPLVEICTTTEYRTTPTRLVANFQFSRYWKDKGTTYTIHTKSCGLELLPFVFEANPPPYTEEPVADLAYQCDCTVVITRITNESTAEMSLSVMFSKLVYFGKEFEIPIVDKGKNVRLLPNSMYSIQVLFAHDHKLYYEENDYLFCNEHFSITFKKDTIGNFESPINKLAYRIIWM